MGDPETLLESLDAEPAPVRSGRHVIARLVFVGFMLAFDVALAAPPCIRTLDAAVQEKPPPGIDLKMVCLFAGVRLPCVEYRLEGRRLVAVYDPDHPDHLLGVRENGRALVCWNGRQRDL
jgi:hypothetical protein